MADNVASRADTSAKSVQPRPPQFTRYLGTYIILIIGAAVAIVPFLYTVSVSLMNLTEANGGAWLPNSPQWGNYIQAWNQANFSQYFWNSVRIAAITISGEIIFCTLAAYAFARMEFWGKNLLFSLLLATLDAAGGDYVGAELHHGLVARACGAGAVDQQLAGADGAVHGQRVQHLPAAPVLHAGPQ